MKVQRQIAPLPPGTAACIGAFDGLHLGHQALLRRAAALQPKVALITFDPHPARVLAPTRAPKLLQNPGQRERVCASLGVDPLVLLPFDREMAAMEPEDFAQRILIDGLRPACVVVGEDFRFGAGRRGGTEELAALLRPANIDVAIVDELCLRANATKIGSTAIRAALRRGEVAAIQAQLGRAFAIAGEVVRGAGRGRGLGVPTANIACPDVLLPAAGVYAAALQVVDPSSSLYGARWPAAANLGTNPTFVRSERRSIGDDGAAADGPQLLLEVHALDVELGEQLYGLEVEVGLFKRLRDEARFADLDGLKAAIAADLDAARTIATAETMASLWPPPPRSSGLDADAPAVDNTTGGRSPASSTTTGARPTIPREGEGRR